MLGCRLQREALRQYPPPPLKHMGRCVQTRDLGRNCRSNVILARITCLVSHHCCDPCHATLWRAHNVAPNFCSFRICHLTPLCCLPTITVSTSTARGVAGRSPSESGSRYTRVSLLQLSRVALHCATKNTWLREVLQRGE